MEILNDKDLEVYFNKREMYTTKEIVNSNFKTQFEANRTYFIDGIDIEWIDETVICYIYSNDIECSFHRTCSKKEFYTEMQKLFIPIAEMYDAWKLLKKQSNIKIKNKEILCPERNYKSNCCIAGHCEDCKHYIEQSKGFCKGCGCNFKENNKNIQ
jgi:hypothetical protein